MDKKSKYLLWGFVLLLVIIAGWGYRTFLIQRDFVINSTTTCDPQVENCFVYCDAGECEIDYYAKITKKAYNIAVCNEALEECEPLVCEPNEVGCEVIYCSISELQDNESCTNIKDFQIENSEQVSTSTEPFI